MQIGELARRTGLSVKTIRFYSDEGLVPEASRSASGYRHYDADALTRLEFVRTLRDLGLDLATIRRVLDRSADLRAVAQAHADALGAQIRLLRAQRAALRALARRDPTPADVERMNRIAQATAEERRRAVSEFLDSIFDLGAGPVSNEFTAMMRGASAELPDDPTDEQLDAWLELADLIRDPDFRERLRGMGAGGGAGAGAGDRRAAPAFADGRRLAALVTERVGAAVAAGVAPSSPEAEPVLAELVAAYVTTVGRIDTPEYRRELCAAVAQGYEPRAERYWQLTAIVNGWPPVPSTLHLWAWFIEALRAHPDLGRPDRS